MLANILLIAGDKGSGKTTLAKRIVKYFNSLGCNTYKYAFANPFKLLLIQSGVLTKEQAFGNDEEKNTKTRVYAKFLPNEVRNRYIEKFAVADYRLTAREVLQVFGTEVRLMFDEMMWINCAQNNIDLFMEHNYADAKNLFVIDDYRFFDLERQLVGNIKSVYIKNINIINTDIHVSENSMNKSKHDLLLSTDKNDPLNLDKNEQILIEKIKEMYHL